MQGLVLVYKVNFLYLFVLKKFIAHLQFRVEDLHAYKYLSILSNAHL